MEDEDRKTWIAENLRIQEITRPGREVDAEGLGREWDGLYGHHPQAFRRSLARAATASRRRLEDGREAA
jgi:hypothetical protein